MGATTAQSKELNWICISLKHNGSNFKLFQPLADLSVIAPETAFQYHPVELHTEVHRSFVEPIPVNIVRIAKHFLRVLLFY